MTRTLAGLRSREAEAPPLCRSAIQHTQGIPRSSRISIFRLMTNLHDTAYSTCVFVRT